MSARRVVALLGLALWLVAGPASAGPASAGPSAPAPQTGVAMPNDPSEVALWSSISAKVSPLVAGWAAGGEQAAGSFIERRWCRAPVTVAECAADGAPRDPALDAGLVRLGTLSSGAPNGHFGVTYAVVDLPASGLGLRLGLTVGGRGLVGDQLSLRWQRVPARNAAPDLLRLGSHLQWALGEHTVEVAMPGAAGPAEALAALAESPAALQRLGLAHLDALEAAFEAALANEALRVCVYAAYENDGEPPACVPRPWTADERAAQRASFQAVVGGWRAALRDDAPALHAALARWAP